MSNSAATSSSATSACACVCVSAACPCGEPCQTCFPPPPSVDAAAPSTASAPLWEECLFLRQFAGRGIARHMAHLAPHVPRMRALYCAYFTLRTRGHVLRGGTQAGADYVAYAPGGAQRWHAHWAVLVGDIEHSGDDAACAANARIEHITRSIMVASALKKGTLYVRIVSSQTRHSAEESAVNADDCTNPTAIFASLRVSVTMLRQWHPTKGRAVASASAAAGGGKREQTQQPQQQQRSNKQQKRAAASAPTARPTDDER